MRPYLIPAFSAACFLAALGCGVALNLITPPQGAGGWVAWSSLLAGGLTLGACGAALGVHALYRAIVADVTHSLRGDPA